MIVHSLRDRALLVAPVRLALGVLWLVAARAAGAGATPALLAFATGAVAFVLLAFTDPRARFLPRGREPRPLPADARIAGPVRQALGATLPSTVGVSVLAAIAVVPQPVLAAFLGGISVGLGIGGLLAYPRIDPELLVDPRSGAVYRR
jgi:hypothetical protein